MKKTAFLMALFLIAGVCFLSCLFYCGGSSSYDTAYDAGQQAESGNPSDNGNNDTGSEDSISGSKGCGSRNFPQSGTYTIDVDGTQRQFIVSLPGNYDPQRPYRLVFAWHYLGGSAEAVARSGYYGLEWLSDNKAIFVAGQGLRGTGAAGWPNTGGRDVAFARALYAELSDNYCVDTERVFSTGMSYGGIMSNTLGCAMGDTIRAIAPIAGMGPTVFSSSQCKGQVAAWIAHGTSDSVVPFSSGEASRNHWVAANSCSERTTPVSPSPCVAYESCDDGYPVHWCEFEGGHIIPSFAGKAIWDFFMHF